MAQASHPTFINFPPPGSNPDTPSEIPGSPNSTTTSLSALSTTAIQDGHRGAFAQGHCGSRNSHNPSTTILDAERADRISRLNGLEPLSTARPPPTQQQLNNINHNINHNNNYSLNTNQWASNQNSAHPRGPASVSPQTTPTSTQGFFFHQNNLTPAYFDNNGQPVAVTKLSTVGTASATESHHSGNDSRTTAGEHEEDMRSTDTNYREAGSVTSGPDAMDEDNFNDNDGARSTGGYDDRGSDDGSASLVGFGEGAGSTVSGPIYHRRPMPSNLATAAAASAHPQAWNLERTNSGMSDLRRETVVAADNPLSSSTLQDIRDARMSASAADHIHDYNDSNRRAPGVTGTPNREAAEIIMQRLDHGESSGLPLGSPGKGGETLGKFYFEAEKDD